MPDHAGIIDILTRLYHEIRIIEAECGLIFGGGDFRPRIDYMHDAIRALVSGQPGSRLSVEMLAYDVEALRYIQSMPLAKLSSEVKTRTGEKKLAVKETLPTSGKKADRNTKLRIAELYQQYGVLFAALLKPLADNDFHSRADELDARAGEYQDTIKHAQRDAGKQALIDSAAHIEDPAIRMEVIALLRQGKTREALALMKKAKQHGDADLKQINDAHTRYVMAQLGLYEEGKDVVKKLAANGMNLAGQFVESAMAQARRDMGGRGI